MGVDSPLLLSRVSCLKLDTWLQRGADQIMLTTEHRAHCGLQEPFICFSCEDKKVGSGPGRGAPLAGVLSGSTKVARTNPRMDE